MNYHSNSLITSVSKKLKVRARWRGLPGAFGKKIVATVDVDHPILENAFPLVLYPGDLVSGQFMRLRVMSAMPCLVICAENNVRLSSTALFPLTFLTLSIRVIEITVYGL